MAQRLLTAILDQPRVKALMSDEHFSVDGTLIQAWAKLAKVPPATADGMPAEGSHKSFQPKPPAPPEDKKGGPSGPAVPAEPAAEAGGRNQERDWRGERRSNETHASMTDPDARLARKSNGYASILAYAGHVLMENRSGLVAQVCLTHATGTAERDAALSLVGRLGDKRRITLGADKGYDAQAFIAELRSRNVTPHIAADRRVSKTGVVRRSAIDGRTTRHPGYTVSQRKRKRVEEVFGWVKAAAGLRQTKHRGRGRVGWCFALATTAYNLIRLPKLLQEAPA